MNIKGRYLAPAAATAVAGLVLAGCSSSGEPTTSDTASSSGDVMAGCEDYAAYGTFDSGTVEVYTTITGVELGQLEDTFTDFQKCTGVTVNVVSSDQFETEINIRISGGNPPDLAIIPQPGLLQTVVGTGSVVAAPASVEANVDQFWSADWKKYGTVGQTFYAAPLMASVKGWIWYSPTEFAANGYTVPTTWDELMTLTQTMADNGGTGDNYKPWCIGFESGTATGWPGTDWIEDIVLRESGTDVYDSWVAGDTKFSSPEIKSAFEKFGAVALNPDYVNGGLGGVSSIVDTSFQEAGLPILDGSCSLHHQASFYEAQWPEGTTVAPDGDVWAFLTPPMNEGDPAAVTGGGEFVAAFNDNPQTAAVQTFMSSDLWANIRVSEGGVISANKGLDPTNASSAIGQEAIKILQDDSTVFRFDGSDLMPSAVGASAFWTEITNYVQGKDLDTVLADIDAAWPQ
ncbi:ABC transporter substrate-binding protein [Demequina capsici]|uniref:ABC transporter substrate-binding protein n=1 Tax=Demequina capsici TaxID=3075620 RepID=A0AA96FDV2_9MICO|nr:MULTISPECIES: ABC transporter substrate-binding protein [unclassified Demequina]WNM24763.1 ABC transporter substrate-binding protein [Demequina sp. OYTSA14]WNM27670.1 ABC transporter substrate-binding protein [Demequina sp. PMTSA13]